jgi:hypothetical protein
VSPLHRLVTSFRRQRWAGVFIELVIVVLGVFIALQVSNWNEARRDRALERQYLERLREDFELTVSGAETNVENMERQARGASLMLRHLRSCRLEDGDQRAEFAAALHVLGRLEPPMLTRGTIEELRSTGRIGIIRNVSLRQAMSNVLQQQERAVDVLGFIVPRRTVQLGYVDSRSMFLVPEDAWAGARPGPEEILFDFPALCRDPAYINAVSHLRQIADVVVGQNRRLLKQYRDMVAMLDAELAKIGP